MNRMMKSIALLTALCALWFWANTAKSETMGQVTLDYVVGDLHSGPVLQIANMSECVVNYYSVRYDTYYIGHPNKPGFAGRGSLLSDGIVQGDVFNISLRDTDTTQSQIESEAKLSHVVFTEIFLKDLTKVSRRIAGEWEFAKNSAVLNVEKCWS